MAGDEPISAVDAGEVIPATTFQNEGIKMMSGSTRTRQGAKQGREALRNEGFHGGAMNGGSGSRRYGVLAHVTANGRHWKVNKLTAMRLEVVAESEEASEAQSTAAAATTERERTRG